MADWYYSNQGRQLGPVSREELRRLAVQGILQPTDMIWKQGMPEWVQASTAKGLIPDRPTQGEPARTTLEAMPSAVPTRPDAPARTTLEPMPLASGVRPATPVADLNRTMLGDTPSSNPKHAVTADSKEERRAPNSPTPRGRPRPQSDLDLLPPRKGGGKKLWFGIIGGVGALLIGVGVTLVLLLRQGDSRSFSMVQGESTDFKVEFQKGKWIEVTVEPDNEGELDLYIFDKEDRQIAFDAKRGNDCLAQFFPKATQSYRIEVRSKGFFGDFGPGDEHVSGKVKWRIRDISELSEIANKAPNKIETTLDFNDRNEKTNRREKEYLFHLDKGNTYAIEMYSRFDNVIKVLDLYNDELAKVDDNGHGRNARLFFSPPKTGVVKVVATSLHGHDTGPFVLNVRPKTATDDTSRTFMIHPFDTIRFDLPLKKNDLMEVAIKDAPANMKLRLLDLANRPVPAIDSNDGKVLFMPAKTEPYRIEINNPNHIGGNNGVLTTVSWRVETMDGLAKSARKAPESITEKLAHNDPQMSPGKYHKTFLFQFDSKETYTIEMSSDFDNYVAVNDLSDTPRVAADGNQSTTCNRIFFQPAKSGVFKVVAATARNFVSGNFKLAVRPKTAMDDVSRSFLLSSSRTARFSVPMTKGDLVEVSFKENLAKMDLRVLDDNNRPIESLDASSASPKVLFVPSATKSYRVEVVNQNAFGTAAIDGTIQWQVRPLSEISKLARQVPVQIVSTIDQNNPRRFEKYSQSYLVNLQEKETYTIDVLGAFDNYVHVKSLSGATLTTSSLSTNTANSRVFFTPTETGVYQVAAGSISGGRTGQMTVSVRKKTTEDDTKRPFWLTRYQTTKFFVTPEKGKQVQFLVVTPNTNKVSIRVYGTASRFRTLGYTDTVNGIARLSITPNYNDTSLRVEVSSRNLSDAAPATGYVTWHAGIAVANVPVPVPLPGVNIGKKVILTKTSSLMRGDVTYNRTKYAKVYSVFLSRNKTYTIDMTSQFDNYLVLQDSRYRTLMVNDDGVGRGLNARIVYRPSISGVYRIIATSLGSAQIGSFSLTVTQE